MTTNREVIQAWSRGDSARAGNLSTDGRHLKSYNLVIGYVTDRRLIDGSLSSGARRYVLDYTAPGGGYHSQTTSTHVNLAKQVADVIWPPHIGR